MKDFANECEEQNWKPADCTIPADDHHIQSETGQADIKTLLGGTECLG